LATKYQTKITKARFVVSPFTGSQMVEFGDSILSMIMARWDRGMDVNDATAPPLVSFQKSYFDNVFKATGSGLVSILRFNRVSADRGYRGFKQRKTGRTIRDLNLTGRLRRSIKVLSASQNKMTLGPTDGMHTSLKRGGQLSFSDVLTLNQRRWRLWGISPSEKAKIVKMFAAGRPVRAVQTRAA